MAEMHGGPAAAAAAGGDGPTGPRSWAELNLEEQGKLLKERLKKYTQKVRQGGGGEEAGRRWGQKGGVRAQVGPEGGAVNVTVSACRLWCMSCGSCCDIAL